VRLESPGPVLFRQGRTGYRGEVFTVYKFRTMRHDAEAGDALESAITRPGDERITEVGRFLRRSRLDELPQLINILRGEMSLIGPRPEAEVLARWYEAELPFYRYRHIVRPGISGWAQVNQGHVAAVDDVLDKLHYDFYYIKNFSPWLDLVIAFRTVMTIFSGFGAR
jgi:lipopolysaccharide/colanic/teichoic acid biosynthesis glycosyltransferase